MQKTLRMLAYYLAIVRAAYFRQMKLGVHCKCIVGVVYMGHEVWQKQSWTLALLLDSKVIIFYSYDINLRDDEQILNKYILF